MESDGGEVDPNYPYIAMERILVIIKPEAVEFSSVIEDKIMTAGFFITQKRRVHLSVEQASEFLSDHQTKLDYPALVTNFSDGPMVAMVVVGRNCVAEFKQLAGPVNPESGRSVAPDSLRSLYGIDEQCNGIHNSLTSEQAEREIRFFFPDTVTEPITLGSAAKEYLIKHIQPTLLRGLSETCKQKPKEPVLYLADWLNRNNPNQPHVNSNENTR